MGGCNQPALLWGMQVGYLVLMGTSHVSAHAKTLLLVSIGMTNIMAQYI